jgi:hypothetical protein
MVKVFSNSLCGGIFQHHLLWVYFIALSSDRCEFSSVFVRSFGDTFYVMATVGVVQ